MAINFKKQIYANNASSSLAFAIDASSTTLSLTDASAFPQPASNQYFTVTLGSGSTYEIVEVYGRSGNVLQNCVRGAQGTTAKSFPAGTLAENRLTASSLQSLSRDQDKLADVEALTDLGKPEDLNNSSCLLNDFDNAGNPIVAVEYSGRWRFLTHPLLLVDQEIYDTSTQVTSTTLLYSSSTDLSSIFVTRGLIVQAVSGSNRGLSRFVSSATSTAVSWTTPFPYAFSYGDRVHVYQSTTSSIAWLTQQIALVSGGQATQLALIQEEIYKTAYKSPVTVATTANITLSGLQTIDGVAVVAGDRVLVKNQTTASQNGIYVVSSAGWTRSTDANDNVKVRPNMMVPVSNGTVNYDSIWVLDATGSIVLGTTSLSFVSIQARYATLASPALTGTPTAPTAAVDTSTTQIATTAYVIGQASSTAPAMDGTATVGTSTRWARSDHVHPSDTTRAPLASPTFTGTPTAPTRPVFDSSTSIATTEFVQRALGSMPGIVAYSGTTTLTATDVGKMVILTTTGSFQTVYLPDIASLFSGATVTIRAAGTHCLTVSSTFQSGDWIAVDQKVTYDTYQQKIYLMPGETITLALQKNGVSGGYPGVLTAVWYATAGDLLSGDPPGTVRFSASDVVPFGSLLANGALVNRGVYARLFSLIGTTYGAGDGTTTFKLPDLRAEFIRGLDLGRGIDTGRLLGSSQADDFKSHTHSVTFKSDNTAGTVSVESNGGLGTAGSAATTATGGTETRPRNVALTPLIRY
jgi:microcystin-dependent protein